MQLYFVQAIETFWNVGCRLAGIGWAFMKMVSSCS
jgi:hypothetical protein